MMNKTSRLTIINNYAKITMKQKIVRYMVLVVVVFCSVVVYSQDPRRACNPRKYIKYNKRPGLLLGYHYPGNRGEIGISRILKLREPQAITKENLKVKLKPPFLIEAALACELDLKPDFWIGPQLSGWITPLSFMRFNTAGFFGTVGYYTIGHIATGVNLIYYTDFSQGNFNFRPDIGWWQPFAIQKFLNRTFNIHMFLFYAYNTTGAYDYYHIGTHQFSAKFTIYWKKVGRM